MKRIHERLGQRDSRKRMPSPPLQNVSFEIRRGGFLASACGKSTLLRVASDLIAPTEGSVSLFGASPAEVRRRRDLGFVFQDAALLPWRTARENVELPLEVGNGARLAERARSPEEMLALVGSRTGTTPFPTSFRAACGSAFRSRARS